MDERERAMARELILARHGDVGPEYAGRYVGHTDLPLSERGRRQAAALAQVLRTARPQKCFTSPAARAVQTAEPAGLDPTVCDDLREIHFGRWEGKTFAEICALDPGLVDRWAELHADFEFPGGERVGDFLERTKKIALHMAACPADVVLAVTHGGVIRAILCHLLGLDPRQCLLFQVDYASLTKVVLFDGKGVLAGLNDTCHLGGL